MSAALNYIFIDSGAMYRGVTLFAMQNGLIIGNEVNEEALTAALPSLQLRFGQVEETGKEHPLLLNGEDVSHLIRSMEVSSLVSKVSSIKAVRTKLVEEQQALGRKGGVIMDGRDIGTVVFPDAQLKLFITASMDIRTQRRYDELTAKGQLVSFSDVARNLQERDHLDSTRKESPLRQAEDAIVIDNTQLDQEQQLNLALSFVQEVLHQSLA